MSDVIDAYLPFAKASLGQTHVVGFICTVEVNSSDGNIDANWSEFTSFYNTLQSAGWKNIPSPVKGTPHSLNSQTDAQDSEGARLIISEAKKCSSQKPLIVCIGGQSSTMAAAYLLDNSIADKVIVFYSSPDNFNGSDENAKEVIKNNLKCAAMNEPHWWPAPAYGNDPIITQTMVDATKNDAVGQAIRTWKASDNGQKYADLGDGGGFTWFFGQYTWKNMANQNNMSYMTDYLPYEQGKVWAATVTLQDIAGSNSNNDCSGIAVTDVTVSPTTISISVNNTQQLTASIAPSNACTQTVTWNSSDPSIANVSSTGVVSGVAAGTATITVTTTDQGKTAACVVMVNAVDNYTALPGTVEAENYSNMSGVQTESTDDTGAGLDIGWIDTDDWLEYQVNPSSSGSYNVDFRVASESNGGTFEVKSGSTVLATIDFASTGGWQKWTTVTKTLTLDAGNQTIQFNVTKGGFNINWWKASAANIVTAKGALADDATQLSATKTNKISVYPNPSYGGKFTILGVNGETQVGIYNVQGQEVYRNNFNTLDMISINGLSLTKGIYIIRISNEGNSSVNKLIVR